MIVAIIDRIIKDENAPAFCFHDVVIRQAVRFAGGQSAACHEDREEEGRRHW
jgi:hypothetical protein